MNGTVSAQLLILVRMFSFDGGVNLIVSTVLNFREQSSLIFGSIIF